MPNLFIIGNGFDIAHKLHTAYSDFRKFLIDNYEADETDSLSPPSLFIGHNGEEIFDNSEISSRVVRMLLEAGIDDNWSDFEHTLGRLDYSEYFDFAAAYDRDGEENPFHTYNNMQDISSTLLQTLPRIKALFREWILTIQLSSIKAPKKLFANRIVPSEDMFLSFNYTHTLEELYGCKNVCHIHGDINSDIFVGHGKDNCDKEYEYYENHYFGAQDAIVRLIEALRKDTTYALNLHRTFFDRLVNINKVYSIGFLYSDIDLVYIREICRITNGSISKWIIDNYKIDDIYPDICNKLHSCGYTGTIEKIKLI
jgi:hypothetical protein